MEQIHVPRYSIMLCNMDILLRYFEASDSHVTVEATDFRLKADYERLFSIKLRTLRPITPRNP